MPDKASIASVMRAMGRVTQDLTRENRRCMLDIDPESSSAEVHLLSDPGKKMEHSWRVSLTFIPGKTRRVRLIRDEFMHFLISSLFPQRCFSQRSSRLSYYSHYPPRLASIQAIATTLFAIIIPASLFQHARSKQISL